MRVTVVGTGYVGLTTAVALAYLGHEVTAVDKNSRVVETLQAGRVPLHEPGLAELFAQVGHRLRYAAELTPDMVATDVILICVGTPPQQNGDADLRHVEEAAQAIAAVLPAGASPVVANKSTVPVGSARRVESLIEAGLAQRGVGAEFAVASNPEFLREGAALHDTLYPDRVVVGATSAAAFDRLRTLYAPILGQTFTPPPGLERPADRPLPVLVTTTPASAELAKYAANAFLAMKISFANEIAGLSERVGADVTEVVRVVGLDGRIGPRYLGAGVGWGGSCFGKDLRALLALGEQYGYELPLATGTIRVNERQRRTVVEKLQQALKVVRGSTVAVWGLTFKPNTDDLRDAPALDVIRRLVELGARVRAYDPVGMDGARRELADLEVEYGHSPEDAARGADAIVLMTEWAEFERVDPGVLSGVMRNRIVVDGRNFFAPARWCEAGFTFRGIGR